jgi:hypothetical protein
MGIPTAVVNALAMGPQPYSTDYAAAMTIVEEMVDKQYLFSFALFHVSGISSVMAGWQASFKASVHPPEFYDEKSFRARDAFAPAAICIAALRAVGVSEDEIQAALKAA